MSDHTLSADARAMPWRSAMPWLVAAGAYALLMLLGGRLLNDPDSYWHLVVGRWIVEHGTVPHVDPFSFTHLGQPWIAKEWLSQVAYAGAYAIGGWSIVAALAAAAIATAFGLLTRALLERLDPVPTLVLVLTGFVLAAPHMVARPHVLALPLMVAWVAGLVRAVDQGRAPSWWLLPLMLIWANAHGGFTLGLALIGPVALEALLTAAPADRWRIVLRWGGFGVAALLTACVTPYGPESILVTRRILGLGEALAIILEWRPQDFSRLAPFELCLLAGLGFALWRGITLPPIRILVLLGLLHMALAHVRNAEVLGLLAPLFLAAPLGRQLHREATTAEPAPAGVTLALVGILVALTGTLAVTRPLAPDPQITPGAAVAAIKRADPGPIFNDYEFGGYLVQEGIAPFIDGRTELYGGPFTAQHHRAVTLEDLPGFLRLLDEHKIGATLLAPSRPAVALLDRLPGWERFFNDDVAVVHIRKRAR